MTALGDVREALGEALGGLDDVTVYPYPVKKIVSPAVVIEPDDSWVSTEYTSGPTLIYRTVRWRVTILASQSGPAAGATKTIERLLDAVFAAIDADKTLGGEVDQAVILSVSGLTPVGYDDASYAGVILTIRTSI